MAFFGLSALGSNSPFEAARAEVYNVTLFEPEEFARAFDQEARGADSIPLDKIPAVLSRVFHGPAPPAEEARVMHYFVTGSVDVAPALSGSATMRSTAGGHALSATATATAASSAAAVPDRSIDKLSFLEGIAVLMDVESRTPLDKTHSAHYNSFQLFIDHYKKGVRPEVAPNQVYQAPLTLAQEMGWRAHEQPVGFSRHPKKHCEETRFFGELLKSGYV